MAGGEAVAVDYMRTVGQWVKESGRRSNSKSPWVFFSLTGIEPQIKFYVQGIPLSTVEKFLIVLALCIPPSL